MFTAFPSFHLFASSVSWILLRRWVRCSQKEFHPDTLKDTNLGYWGCVHF
jgi:hypothetical protein